MSVQTTSSKMISQDATPPADAHTRLRGRWLLLARVAWFITVVVISGLYILSVPLQAQALQSACTNNCLYGQHTAAQMQELLQLG